MVLNVLWIFSRPDTIDTAAARFVTLWKLRHLVQFCSTLCRTNWSLNVYWQLAKRRRITNNDIYLNCVGFETRSTVFWSLKIIMTIDVRAPTTTTATTTTELPISILIPFFSFHFNHQKLWICMVSRWRSFTKWDFFWRIEVYVRRTSVNNIGSLTEPKRCWDPIWRRRSSDVEILTHRRNGTLVVKYFLIYIVSTTQNETKLEPSLLTLLRLWTSTWKEIPSTFRFDRPSVLWPRKFDLFLNYTYTRFGFFLRSPTVFVGTIIFVRRFRFYASVGFFNEIFSLRYREWLFLTNCAFFKRNKRRYFVCVF